MLKILFFILLLANGLLFAFHQGYLDSVSPAGHEPERMKSQLNADKIRLIAAPAASPQPAAPAQESAAVAPASTVKTACIEIGAFTPAEARRFEAQLAALPAAVKAERVEITEPSSHMVLIPSQGDKAGADKKIAELRALGVTDYFVLQDPADPALRWGISLGVFKSEEAARAYLTQMSQKGVRSARLVAYKGPMKKIGLRLQVDNNLRTALDKIKADFPNQQLRDCPTSGQNERGNAD